MKAGQPAAVVQGSLEAAFVALVESRFVVRGSNASDSCFDARGQTVLIPPWLCRSGFLRVAPPARTSFTCVFGRAIVRARHLTAVRCAQTIPHVAAVARGRGAARGGAAAAAWEAVTVEIAAQRAREETERFLLPESLVERVQAREFETELEDGSSARKRKRAANGEFGMCSASSHLRAL